MKVIKNKGEWKMTTVYGVLVLIHVISAVAGFGVAFTFPIINKFAKTKEQLKWTNELMEKLEKPVKIASITLLVTGVIMGAINPYLFKEGWYITSILLYIIAQVLVIGIATKTTKESVQILENSTGDTIPTEVVGRNKKIDKVLAVASVIAVIMIFLMSVKPF
jgi:uncharacterized membrane protein